MLDISKIDKNFVVDTNIKKDNIHFYNVEEAPFQVYGVFKENGTFCRMPAAAARKVG